VKRLVFSPRDLPVLVEVRAGVEKRLYTLNAAGRRRCGAMLQAVPEALARELEKGKSAEPQEK
jgi:hypothetical protein